MTNLGLILSTLYRNADPLRDYRVQDDGNGPYIAHWDEAKLGPQPDAATLQAVDVVKIQHNAGIDRQIIALESRITKRMLIDAAAGKPYSMYLNLVQQIAELRAKRQ